MPSGIKDKVVILGMGCTKFDEHWGRDADSLAVEAYAEALSDAGVDNTEIDAAWAGVAQEQVNVGASALPISIALRLNTIPVTKVENYCASGTEALRGAVYAVASGASDIALAIGVEKLKDTGYGGLPARTRGVKWDMIGASGSAPGNFAQLAAAYGAKHSVEGSELKRAMAHVSVKSHDNAVKNPKAHLRNRIDIDKVVNAPMVASPLGLYDCCGVSDGAACAILTTPERARSLGKTDLVSIKALSLAVSNGWELQGSGWDGSYFHTTRVAASRAYREAGISDPSEQVGLMEVHDCFSITELVTMEDLHISEEGSGWRDVLDGRFDADGANPCQIDGGLKCFGHPIAASGLRMLYENYLQFLGRAEERQRAAPPEFALTHNLGGMPNQNVAAISITGML